MSRHMARETNGHAAVAERALQIYLLGMLDFEAALSFQRRLQYEIGEARSQAALILCEHAPLITVGRQGSRSHILCEPEELQLRDWRVRWVNRGGGCVLHQPGQLALYPIFPLDDMALSPEAYVENLGKLIQDFLAEFDVPGRIDVSPRGVWVGQRPLAGIGVAVRQWITYYGAYINIHPDLELQRLVRWGNRRTEPMTSLERERKGRVRPALVRERLVELVRQRFGFSRVSLFTDHPTLKGFVDRCQAQRVSAV